MSIKAIFANISCSHLETSIPWYETILARSPDANPMKGLVEWHFAGAGLQVFEGPDKAGHGTLTLIVDDVRAEHERLTQAGFEPGTVQEADYTTIVQLRDPDGNLVVLAQPGKA
ncbi:hypothetical protein VE26_08525 [Devosia chinhatensis]|uniref:VOC domain-containing protein n=2 Tax=Devosia chinhatensis TaxID=429727 RepID=A0A0F5FMR6_9HYPH|nr:VOC family protein [Devosia chinhatensis]KKB09865.1 hypothetical protein VE26_08525 [Devosia chinhatensis]